MSAHHLPFRNGLLNFHFNTGHWLSYTEKGEKTIHQHIQLLSYHFTDGNEHHIKVI